MKVKQYRAATMREALEKVKGELGDDALVLSSKSIRDRGFLGFGTKNLVEVSVSTDLVSGPSVSDENKAAARRSKFTSMDLNKSERPELPTLRETPRAGAGFAALVARAYSAEASSNDAPSMANVLESTGKTTPQVTEPLLSKLESTTTPSLTVKRDPVIVELDRLRAEIREVKFAIGTFAHYRSDIGEPAPAGGESDMRVYDSPFYEAYLRFGALGLRPDVANAATVAAIAADNEGSNIQDLARIGLIESLPSFVKFGADPLTRPTNSDGAQPVVALVGPTGVGKTTTIAKLAARVALREQRRVELITLDTYRIAAIEQLTTYAEIIGAGIHVAHTILELEALVRRFSGQATVMIDTIGRSAQDLADQMDLAAYLANNKNIIKTLVIQATMHPADAQLAIGKYALFGINNLVITKVDETCRPGGVVATAAEAGVPLTYLCNGQRVPEDIEPATAQSLTDCILRTTPRAMTA